jgi:hypothetical protein
MKMIKYDEKASKSDLYARVKLTPVNAIERSIAVSALRDADVVSNRILWVVRGLKRLAARATAGFGQLTHGH